MPNQVQFFNLEQRQKSFYRLHVLEGGEAFFAIELR
tara:strand:+ start:768 stop:875 length:108 start_codon:yes stop_codon:yes gene_type:complete